MKKIFREKYRLVLTLAVCVLFVAVAFSGAVGRTQSDGKFAIDNKGNEISSERKPAKILHPTYEPEDIDLEDAAFHRSYGRYHGEWWYFEGIFDNGYSIVLGIATLSKGDSGLCILALHVYNATKLEIFLHKNVSFKEFEASEKYPFIRAFGKPVMMFDRAGYNQTGEWVYNVSIEIDGQEANLTFTGSTKGYKGEILRGWYGPVLPKADVEGTLILNGDQINVSGLGYHEHGYEIAFPIFEWGWYWSKIVSDSYTLTWAKMMNTRWWEQTRAAIFSQDQGGYININPENIKLKASKYRFDNWRIIPTKFVLNISDPENRIYVNVTMETLNTHHIGVAYKLIHYWKYHLKVNGEITYGSITETIEDEIQVLEITRFR